ncbi:hypothetical protein H6G52_13185 [Limnothrix sp. FACHB-881]|uniref:hypothetical protein n=1 Tax=unclassified Limnothrix TaxID=2632864 RepID=UPI0016888259|nr:MULTISPECIES: hypothetical protein [unclassified Limnothrix]MBD2554454.1 hypothetical protein [Limnothrix sp. FACHB-708]MBD2589438.1 hypothetical protein [Limnothrix sp. FACHB-406]MBD2636318.1 hypothetical protein [Limnothrix sp. FACHB-881]
MILGTINAFKSRAGSPRLETDAEVSASLVRQRAADEASTRGLVEQLQWLLN